MKKLFLTLAFIATTLVLAVTYACSSDSSEQESVTTKAQLLLNKSHEFAQKYHVSIYLNEENINEIAKTMTVEQLEAMYVQWAKQPQQSYTIKLPAQAQKLNGRVKLRRRAELREDFDETIKGNSVIYQFFFDFCKKRVRTVATVEWILRKRGRDVVTLTVENDSIYGHAEMDVHPTVSAPLEFSAQGEIHISSNIFKEVYVAYIAKGPSDDDVSLTLTYTRNGK